MVERTAELSVEATITTPVAKNTTSSTVLTGSVPFAVRVRSGDGDAGGVPPSQVSQARVVREHLDDRLVQPEALLNAFDVQLLVPQHEGHDEAVGAGPGGAP